MKRRLFNILAAVSLVTFVALLLWYCNGGVLARHYGDRQGWSSGESTLYGIVRVRTFDAYVPVVVYFLDSRVMLIGIAAAAIPPAYWFQQITIRLRDKRIRRQRGECLSCGYNLTGNNSGICPECGTAIPRDSSKESATT